VIPGRTYPSVFHRASTGLLLVLALFALFMVACASPASGSDTQAGGHRVVVPGVSRDGPLPTPTPAPTPTPTPIPTGPSTLVEHGPRGTGQVALTFDMGGRVDPAIDIMQFLIDNGVHATIFITGASVDQTPEGRQVLALVAAHPELFVLGNHSYYHPDFTTIPDSRISDELFWTESAILNYSSLRPKPWFRPPFGAWDQRVLNVVGASGYAYTVMWDIDTIDWRPESDGGPTTSQIVAKVINNAQGGSIVLMHLGGYNTLDALPGIVNGLRADGYELVNLDEMFGRN
jgi:peptidoglycan/xylan/chitin deacetylase (PgdA/CDA1 family)